MCPFNGIFSCRATKRAMKQGVVAVHAAFLQNLTLSATHGEVSALLPASLMEVKVESFLPNCRRISAIN